MYVMVSSFIPLDFYVFGIPKNLLGIVSISTLRIPKLHNVP
ncbi:hypothetical protein XIS1_1440041 [Xenorhabdus innexi]|uniref:Uncharacterized protein n=1 Tax=Xenorhabdus innexi TaxID=290109 RepID=A0A1N6MUE9_9GAMM|nr:hypothetical protein XIS1_1440041 [Xenorhabdus innexi]